MTSALRWGWVVSTTPRPLYPRERPGTHCYSRLGGPQGRSRRVRKISPPPIFDPRTVQPVASRYTDWAIPARTVYIEYSSVFISFVLNEALRMMIHSSFLAGRNYARVIGGSRVNKTRLLQLFGRINTDCHVLSTGRILNRQSIRVNRRSCYW